MLQLIAFVPSLVVVTGCGQGKCFSTTLSKHSWLSVVTKSALKFRKPAFLQVMSARNSKARPLRDGSVRDAADITKWVVVVSMSAIVLYRNDISSVLFALGSILNSILGKFLKRLIKQSRPDGATKCDPGMPSSHAISLSFISIAILVNVVKFSHLNFSWSLAGALIVVFLGAVASWWRIAAGYHTVSQVFAGWILGAFDAVIWCSVVTPVLRSSITHFIEHSNLFSTIPLFVIIIVVCFYILDKLGTGTKLGKSS